MVDEMTSPGDDAKAQAREAALLIATKVSWGERTHSERPRRRGTHPRCPGKRGTDTMTAEESK